MDTVTKNARLRLRDAKGHELPVMHLKETGLVLARMAAPGAVQLLLDTTELTRVTVHLDGVQLFHTEAMLQPGRHVFKPEHLVISAVKPVDPDDEPLPLAPNDDDVFLASLGIEPERKFDASDLPYTGAPGGVLSVRLGYYVEDTGRVKEIETTSDELVIKISVGDDFDRAIASNVHRLRFSEDPDAVAQPTLCGTCHLHEHHH